MDAFEQDFAGVSVEVDLASLESARILARNGNGFRVQELLDKVDILPSYAVLLGDRGKHVSSTEDLSHQGVPPAAKVHHRVDQQLHGIDPVAGHHVIVPQIRLSRQEDVVHPPDLLDGIKEANRHTGTEKGFNDGRFLAGIKPTNVNTGRFFHFGSFSKLSMAASGKRLSSPGPGADPCRGGTRNVP